MRILRALAATAVALALLPAIPAASGAERSSGRSAGRTLPALTRVPADALTKALNHGELTDAEYALERATSLFRLPSVRNRFGAVARPHGRDATLILRDLAMRAEYLSGDDRTAAEAILARPDDSIGEPYGQPYKEGATVEVICANGDVKLCVHFVPTGGNDPFNRTDPAWAASTLAEMTNVWDQEITEMGFRPPRSDGTSKNDGGDDRTDIYLANIGSDGVYGYCSTDDPELYDLDGRYDLSAYCVLDNDYTEDAFQNLTPLENMQVTAAHEFFHAVQFAYDFFEDAWFMEGTAAWVEDEVYDEVNDNYQYLDESPMTQPGTPLDRTNGSSLFMNRYGAWIFWRYLSEAFSDTPQTVDHDVIQSIWELADGASGGPNNYSLQAVKRFVVDQGTSFRGVMGGFAASAFAPETFFEEGAGYLDWLVTNGWNVGGGGRPPLSLNKTLSASTPSGRKAKRLDHLSSAYYAFGPAGSVSDSSMLRLKVKGPARRRGTTATALVHGTNGLITVHSVFSLNSDGDGNLTVPFGPSSVQRVVVVASNASTKFVDCGFRSYLSCGGRPKFDNQKFVVRGKLLQ